MPTTNSQAIQRHRLQLREQDSFFLHQPEDFSCRRITTYTLTDLKRLCCLHSQRDTYCRPIGRHSLEHCQRSQGHSDSLGAGWTPSLFS